MADNYHTLGMPRIVGIPQLPLSGCQLRGACGGVLTDTLEDGKRFPLAFQGGWNPDRYRARRELPEACPRCHVSFDEPWK